MGIDPPSHTSYPMAGDSNLTIHPNNSNDSNNISSSSLRSSKRRGGLTGTCAQWLVVFITCLVLGYTFTSEFRVVPGETTAKDSSTMNPAVAAGIKTNIRGQGNNNDIHHQSPQTILGKDQHDQQQQEVQSDDSNKDGDDTTSPPALKIAWLMSFPNSGTSYTLRLTRFLSETRTATNYGSEALTSTSPAKAVSTPVRINDCGIDA